MSMVCELRAPNVLVRINRRRTCCRQVERLIAGIVFKVIVQHNQCLVERIVAVDDTPPGIGDGECFGFTDEVFHQNRRQVGRHFRLCG